MWKASVGRTVPKDATAAVAGSADDWDTDPDFVNDVSEKEQRWGAKTVEGSGHVESMSLAALREQVQTEDKTVKKKQYEAGPKGSHGYGGQFGVETGKMDKSAVGHDYQAPKALHASQTDGAKGFGGKFGVQGDRKDKSAAGWEHHEKVEKHTSQKDGAGGYGGKYGVQSERVDKSAVGWDYKGQTDKHQSQTDASQGFGGKFGVQTERVDKSAKGYSDHTAPELHPSQTDHKKGFGGKFGVQADRVDKSAHGYEEKGTAGPTGTDYQKTKPVVTGSAGAGKLKAKFEGLAAASEEKDGEPGGRKKVPGGVVGRKNVEPEQKRPQATEDQHETVGALTAPVADLEMGGIEESKEAEGGAEEEVEEKEEELYQDIEPPHVSSSVTAENPDDEIYANADDLDQGGSADPSGSVEVPPKSEGEAGRGGKVAVALYDYQAADEDELPFDPDDEIIDIEFVDDDWWRGSCRGRRGLFPANYVQLKED